MSRRTVTFTAETTKKFATNARRGDQYQATIHNFTGETVTVTVTNKDIQGTTTGTDFDTPAQGALAITDGAIGVLNEAYDGWLLTAGASATGTVEITESG